MVGSSPTVSSHSLFLFLYVVLQPHVKAQGANDIERICDTMQECAVDFPRSCQDWFQRSFEWSGTCCSLQEITSDDGRDTCRLISNGRCTFRTADQDCELDRLDFSALCDCSSYGTSVTVIGGAVYDDQNNNITTTSTTTSCPTSKYDPLGLTATTENPVDASTSRSPSTPVPSTTSPSTLSTEFSEDPSDAISPSSSGRRMSRRTTLYFTISALSLALFIMIKLP